MLDLFIFGAGLQHTLLDPQGNVTIDQPEHALVLGEFLRTYSTYRFVPPDTINHSFTEMYQVIEGGAAACSASATGMSADGTRRTRSTATSSPTPGRNSSGAATRRW